MIFCRQCSNLLNLPGDADEIICDTCGALEDASGKLRHLGLKFSTIRWL